MEADSIRLARAVNDTLAAAMEADPRVVVLGEAVGRLGGVFRTTVGLLERFGPDRVVELPLTEAGAVGLAVGLAMGGMRPVVELSGPTGLVLALEQLLLEAGTLADRTEGALVAPVVLRVPTGGGVGGGPFVQAAAEQWLVGAEGVDVVVAASPADAAGLLRGALASPRPTVILEPQALYDEVGPASPAVVPAGKARVLREGAQVTILAWGRAVVVAMEAAAVLEGAGVSAGVVDVRSLAPLDEATLALQARATGRVVVVHEGSAASADRVLRAVVDGAFLHLEAPPEVVAGEPELAAVVAAARRVIDY